MGGSEMLVCEFVIHLLFLVIHRLASIAENDEARMTNDESSQNDQMTKDGAARACSHSYFVIPSSLGIRHSSFHSFVIVACPVKSFRFHDENGNTTDLVWAVRI